jgi:penicillin amidase/acyl-homoserine-lactone acylase|tara:strand:- start:368 stop:2479 length:2112 start_codon:yes stop_codon:yes gene_type:complete
MVCIKIMRILLLIQISFLLISCQSFNKNEVAFHLKKAESYRAEITRDIWGVPHVYGESDADAAFGLAFAHAEDDFKNTAENMYLYRAEMGLRDGADGAIQDYLIKVLKIREKIEQNYLTELNKDVRKVLEAYAAGINYWMIQNPDNDYNHFFPITEQDIVAGFAIQNLFFSGVVSSIEKLQREENSKEEYTHLYENEQFVTGSNVLAVNSSKTSDQSTRIIINSHQPLDGPLAWYEAQVSSDEGWNIMGGLFPGSPFIFVGFNENIAWGFTVNKPDLSDSYLLKINPENENQYLLDGKWKDFEIEIINLPIKIFGPLKWTIKREAKYSAHGPVLEVANKSYALRFSGMNDIKQVNQWFAMNKSNSLDEWIKAMKKRSIISFNGVFADKEDNIFFLHNSSSPKRLEGINWKEVIDGTRSDLIWDSYVDFSEIPQFKNPSSGWIASTNQDPFKVTSVSDNLKSSNYSSTLGLQTRMTNRAYRSIELFDQYKTVNEEEFDLIKFDNKYSKQSRSYSYVSKIFDMDFESPKLNEARDVLKNWDLGTDFKNTSAALGVCVLSNEWISEQGQRMPQDPEISFRECVGELENTYGRVNPPWSERNFIVRGDKKISVQGGPDVLRAIYGRNDKEGDLKAAGGDGLYIHVSWDKNGKQNSKSIHQYGSSTQHIKSKHFDDQVKLYVEEKYKPTFFDKKDLEKNTASVYYVPK